jgi:hypothetical protein
MRKKKYFILIERVSLSSFFFFFFTKIPTVWLKVVLCVYSL